MIENEQEYQNTLAEIEQFEQALAAEQDDDLHPLLRQAMKDGLESQLLDLRRQVAVYESALFGRSHERLTRDMQHTPGTQAWSLHAKQQAFITVQGLEMISHQLRSLAVVHEVAQRGEVHVAKQLLYFIDRNREPGREVDPPQVTETRVI